MAHCFAVHVVGKQGLFILSTPSPARVVATNGTTWIDLALLMRGHCYVLLDQYPLAVAHTYSPTAASMLNWRRIEQRST